MASALLASRNEPHWGEGKVYMRQNPNFTPSFSNPNKKQQIYDHQQPSTTHQNHHGRFQQQQKQQHSNNLPPDAPPPMSISNDSSSHNRNPNFVKDKTRRGVVGVGFGQSTKNGYIKFNISEYSKKELKDLKRRFISELEQIRELSTRIESRQSSSSRSGGGGGGGGDPGGSVSPNFSLPTTKKVGGLKRPFPFAADTKRGPSMVETKLIGNMMKRCGTILKNMMKHRHGYIFNQPVDPIKENLHDYNSVIRKPMDLGTVKHKFTNNVYKNPEEFAADVRLTFNNALIYNPKGHEVYVLAELLLKQFNESFEPAYEKFENDMKKLGNENDSRNGGIVVPIGISDVERERSIVRQKASSSSTTPDRMRTVTPDRIMHKPPPFRGNSNPQSSKQLLHPPQSPPMAPPAPPPQPVMPAAAAHPVYHQQAVKQMSGGIGRPCSGKQPKPKARDANKRDMSHSEKQKLGDDLQNLPLDKMDQALQIIRKIDPDLCQVGDEIEIDFEAMDIETLWELDRFVGNYKKMLSKMRKQSLSGGSGGNQHYAAVEENKSPMAVEMPEVAAVKNRKAENIGMEEDVDIGEDIPTSNFPPVEIEKDAGYASGDSSGSSSSDDSSSDSDSDSGSSSGSDSDADEAQSPFIESKASKPNDGANNLSTESRELCIE